jgi:hypothetical protein
MLDFIDPDPGQALLKIAVGLLVVVLSVLLWRELQHRSRRSGGGNLAAAAMAAAVVGLMVAISNALPMEIGIVVLFLSLFAIYRPEQVVKVTGGPRLEWRALREGRELQLLVKERGGPSLAKRNPEVQERFEALSSLEGPGTERYIGLLRETLLADPAAPGMEAKLAELAEADAALRVAIGARPNWEKELERRAAEGAPAEAE